MAEFKANACRYRAVLSASAAGFTAFLNIYALQSLLPLLADTFKRPIHQVSLAVSATALGVALASPLAGWLVSRFQRGPITRVAVGGLVLCGLKVAFSPQLPDLIVWRFAQGMFLPLLVTAALSFMAQDAPREQLARLTSLYVTWTIIGGFAGRWLGGAVAGVWGWRIALLVLALANALSGLVLLATLADPEQRLAAKKLPTGRDFLNSLADAPMRASYLTGFLTLFTMVGTFTYVTFHLAQGPFCLSAAQLGKLFAVYLIGVAVTPQVGALVARWEVHGTVRRGVMLAVTGLLLTLGSSLQGVVLGLALICVAGFGAQAAVSGWLARLPEETKSVGASLYLSFYYLGGCLGAALPGYLWPYGGWTACVVLLMVAQGLVFCWSRPLSTR